MKKFIFNTFALFVLLFATSAFTAPVSFDNQLITLPAGTVVSLELNEEINANELQTGNILDFMVRSNVTVNGQIVIAAGAIAEGRVKKVTPGCKGQCATLIIEVSNVQAVDGQRVYLRSRQHIVKAPCCNGCRIKKKNNTATLIIGTNLSATIQNNVVIEA